jgi:hypothetical protein
MPKSEGITYSPGPKLLFLFSYLVISLLTILGQAILLNFEL